MGPKYERTVIAYTHKFFRQRLPNLFMLFIGGLKVLQLIKHFIDICRFKSLPEQTPYSIQVMVLAIISYMGMAYVVFSPSLSSGKAMLIVVVDIAMLLGFIYAGLWICSYLNRILKMVTSMAGSGAILYIFGYPIIMVLQLYAELSVIPTILFSVWVLWKVAITAHLIRHGLSIPIWLSLGVSVLYVYTYLRIMAAAIIAGI